MSHTVKLWADVDGENIEVTVGFDYQPYEPMSWSHPGCASEVSIYDVLDGKVDITSLLTDEENDALVQAVHDHHDDMAERRAEDRAADRYDDLREDV